MTPWGYGVSCRLDSLLAISLGPPPQIMNYNRDFSYNISWLNYCLLCHYVLQKLILLHNGAQESPEKHKNLPKIFQYTLLFIFWVKLPFKAYTTFHLASPPFILNTLHLLWPQSTSPRAHYLLLSLALCKLFPLPVTIPNLIFPANTTRSSRATSGIIHHQKGAPVSPPVCHLPKYAIPVLHLVYIHRDKDLPLVLFPPLNTRPVRAGLSGFCALVLAQSPATGSTQHCLKLHGHRD